jgi:hypothetical protein
MYCGIECDALHGGVGCGADTAASYTCRARRHRRSVGSVRAGIAPALTFPLEVGDAARELRGDELLGAFRRAACSAGLPPPLKLRRTTVALAKVVRSAAKARGSLLNGLHFK